MISPWELPTSLEIGGEKYKIRTDFRPILDILKAFNDPELPDYAKIKVMAEILYIDPPPVDYLKEAIEKAKWFIDCGKVRDNKPKSVLMDWEQDSAVIFPAVNKIAGYETRLSNKYTHWWTFVGFFDEIDDGLFSQILSIRQKKAKGKRLEQWEVDFFRENKELIELKNKFSPKEKERIKKEEEAVDALFQRR